MKKEPKSRFRLKEGVEPALGSSLHRADELQEAEFSAVLLPQFSAERWRERVGQQDEEQPAIEITERAVRSFGRECR